MLSGLLRRPEIKPLLIERSPEEDCLATFWSQATPGSAYVRLTLPARYLPGQVHDLQDDDLAWDDEKDEFFMPRQRGASIWQFIGDKDRGLIAAALSEQGVRILMEVDDNYLRRAPYMGSEWARTIKEGDDRFGYSHEGHKRLTPMFDGIIVSTPYLAEIYSEHNDNVYVCPNCVDPIDWKFERPESDGILRIVYAGSPSHTRDAPLLTKALKWAARQKDVEVYTMGFDHPWSFAQKIPWDSKLEVYRDSLSQFDVGLAPLRRDVWSNSKSDLKFLEYAMAGVMPLVQRAEPYAHLEQRFPELVVDDWMESLEWVLKNRDDVVWHAYQAQSYVLSQRTIQKNIHHWEKAIRG